MLGLLRDTLRKYKDVRTMIFCNSGERVKYVYNFLRKLKIKATYVTSDLLPKKVRLACSNLALQLMLTLPSAPRELRGICRGTR